MSDATDLGRAEATRMRLAAAAVEAFADKGFHGTTTREIAAIAGLSSAALYVHHRSKEELLYEISKAGHEQVLTLLRDAIASAESPTVALQRAIHDFSAHHARDHVAARVINYELSALAPDHLAEIQEIRHTIEAEVRQLITWGVDEEEFQTPDPAIAAAAVLSLSIDLGRWFKPGGRWTAAEVAERYADFALRIVGAQSQ